MQGDALQALWQLPAEQLHVPPPEHDVLWRGVPVPGSGTAGPPFGVITVAPPSVPLPTVLLDPPQATMKRRPKPTKQERELRKV